MRISRPQQMIACTAALSAAAAIAGTPITPAAPLPSPSTTDSAVVLAAFYNPIEYVVDTGALAMNYAINPNFTHGPGGGEANWGTGIGTNSGIGDAVNELIYNSYLPGYGYLPDIKAIGLLPNFAQDPFPVGSQVLSNLLNYATTVVNTGAQVLGDLTSIAFAPVAVVVELGKAIITGQISTIPTLIADAVQQALGLTRDTLQTMVSGAQSIVASVAAKTQAVITAVSTGLPTLFATTQKTAAALATIIQTNLAEIGAAAGTGDVETLWNQVVVSMLGPTGIPGALLNLTMGAGVQFTPADPASFAPSVRAILQTMGQTIAGALGAGPVSAAGASPARPAAAARKSGPAAATPAAGNRPAQARAKAVRPAVTGKSAAAR